MSNSQLSTTLLVFLSLALKTVHAHDMSSMDSDSSMMNMNMGIFHTALGTDTLWFNGWMPTTSGATAGAALGLAALSIFYRFTMAFRATLERSWRLQLCEDRIAVSIGSNGLVVPVLRRSANSSSSSSSEDLYKGGAVEQQLSSAVPSGSPTQHKEAFLAARRLAPPFALNREVTRGVLQAFTSFIGYLLMLAVMTTNAWFFIAIVLGLGVGEFLFGRYAVPEDH